MTSADSILDYLDENARHHGAQTAALVKVGGLYAARTWNDLYEASRRVSAALVALGVQPGDRVCLVAQTRVEWVTCDLGILGAGAITVPIYPSSVATECRHIAIDAGAVVVIVEDETQVAKFRSERAYLTGVRKILQLDGESGSGDPWVATLASACEGAPMDEALLAERRAKLHPEAIATLMYTSGTTGAPKGVVCTHGNLIYEAQAFVGADLIRPTDRQLLFLPLAHSFAKLVMVGWLATRMETAFAERVESVAENLIEARPTVLFAVPRLYEKIHAAVLTRAQRRGVLARTLVREALSLSRQNGEAEALGRTLGPSAWGRFEVARHLVFRRLGNELRKALGGRMRLLVSGGAPLPPTVGWLFRDAGLEILEGYGLTESTAGSVVNRPGDNRVGTVGHAVPGTEIRIAPDGEVLIRGPGVMRGYWQRPDETAEALDAEGFLHTGDLGELAADGRLRITGRKKEIIITAGGKNIAPAPLEHRLRQAPLISHAVVYGDSRRYLTALLTLDAQAATVFAAQRGLGGLPYAQLTQAPEVHAAVAEIIDDVNQGLARFETIKRFRILDHDLSEETGELTPSLKVKRNVVYQRYRALFDGMYEEA